MMTERDFRGKTAVVTGATSGIGRAIVLRMMQLGATVHALGRDAAALAELNGAAGAMPGSINPHSIDLTSDEDLQRLAAGLGNTDVLVHAAGVIKLGPVLTSSVTDLDWHYHVNLRAAYLLSQLLLPRLIESRGQLVFVNSSADRPSGANKSQYAATKYALLALSECLRDEVKSHGVSVLNVFLGRVATPMQAAVFGMEGRAYQPDKLIQPEDVATAVTNALLLSRTAEVGSITIRATT
jgi:NADP-dependent 3-hydroxy acid dehydrogenase YdfG